jgi:hypothetical protein
MAFRASLLVTGGLVAGLAIAPAARADQWRHHHHHHNNNAAGAAIVGGLVGLGVGAAIASGGGYYGWPYSYTPYNYYAPPPAYYTPAPPPAYYGYGSGY